MKDESPIRIAIIDDHLKLRSAVAKYLKNFNYQVIWQAANGIEMLTAIVHHTNLPNVCILDINMPEMDGFEAAKQLSINFPKVKILAFSGNADEESVIEMIRSGAMGYLVKGCEAIEIKRAVDHLLNEKYYFSESVKEMAFKHLNT
ncbi:response regulator transcription factor [uncultured Flavobacterium sp.]|uniref:response regulator n=1 Tax=uncultured Flavobacterium sp. TaxID=165435 RepID=UPI0025DA398C|nr:response regulator transcription factor [uncultured Flavobacterium sp.]